MRVLLSANVIASIFIPALATLALSGCKPPPTDEAGARGTLAEAPVGPSQPIDSPDTSEAIWAPSTTAGRLLFGNPGEHPLLALDCVQQDDGSPAVQFTRFAPSDEGAGAFLAVVGNFHVIRVPVDAIELGSSRVWQGAIRADHPNLEAMTGRREMTLTVPGAGMLKMQPDEAPRALIAGCRAPLEESTDEELASGSIVEPDPPASAE